MYREIQDHWIYRNPLWYRWWSDMLFWASYKNSKILVRKQVVELKRGQLCGSISYFTKAWATTKEQVIDFLKILQSEGMIDKKTDKNITIITICNYESYQGGGDKNSDNLSDSYSDSNSENTSDNNPDNNPDRNPDTNKEVKEVKEIYNNNSNARTREEKTPWESERERGFCERFKAQGCGMKVSRVTGKQAAEVMQLLAVFMDTCELRNQGHKDFEHFNSRFLWAIQNGKLSLPQHAAPQPKVISGKAIFDLIK